MTAQTPIPQNIRRLRAARGMSQEQVARKAGLSRNAFRSIETGQAEPRVGSLLGIARALGVDLPALLAEPPRLSTVRFRSRKPQSRRNRALRDQLVVEAARWLNDFNALEELLGQRIPYALAGLPDRFPDQPGRGREVQAARLARGALGLRSDEPIRSISGLLESAGLKVRTVQSALPDLFGLSIAAADGGPAIVVNARDDISVERRIFTAAHELGHLLLHPEAYDVTKVAEDPRQEKQGDLFAGHFLMPDDPFRKEWHVTYGLPFVDRVLHVKRIFRVSYQTVLFRLGECGIADPRKAWATFQAQWRRRSGQALTKKVEPAALVEADFLTDRLSRLVREAVESEKITLSRAAEILGVDLGTMRDRAASWEVAA